MNIQHCFTKSLHAYQKSHSYPAICAASHACMYDLYLDISGSFLYPHLHTRYGGFLAWTYNPSYQV